MPALLLFQLALPGKSGTPGRVSCMEAVRMGLCLFFLFLFLAQGLGSSATVLVWVVVFVEDEIQ